MLAGSSKAGTRICRKRVGKEMTDQPPQREPRPCHGEAQNVKQATAKPSGVAGECSGSSPMDALGTNNKAGISREREPATGDNVISAESIDRLSEQLRISEANRKGAESANRINHSLMLQAEERWHQLYRLVFPEESPWEPVVLGPTLTHSPYQWDKLVKRIGELRNPKADPSPLPGEQQPSREERAIGALVNLIREDEYSRTGKLPSETWIKHNLNWWLAHGFDPPCPKCANPDRHHTCKAERQAQPPATSSPVSKQALYLCWEIEKLPASELQTNISILASNLRTAIEAAPTADDVLSIRCMDHRGVKPLNICASGSECAVCAIQGHVPPDWDNPAQPPAQGSGPTGCYIKGHVGGSHCPDCTPTAHISVDTDPFESEPPTGQGPDECTRKGFHWFSHRKCEVCGAVEPLLKEREAAQGGESPTPHICEVCRKQACDCGDFRPVCPMCAKPVFVTRTEPAPTPPPMSAREWYRSDLYHGDEDFNLHSAVQFADAYAEYVLSLEKGAS